MRRMTPAGISTAGGDLTPVRRITALSSAARDCPEPIAARRRKRREGRRRGGRDGSAIKDRKDKSASHWIRHSLSASERSIVGACRWREVSREKWTTAGGRAARWLVLIGRARPKSWPRSHLRSLLLLRSRRFRLSTAHRRKSAALLPGAAAKGTRVKSIVGGAAESAPACITRSTSRSSQRSRARAAS